MAIYRVRAALVQSKGIGGFRQGKNPALERTVSGLVLEDDFDRAAGDVGNGWNDEGANDLAIVDAAAASFQAGHVLHDPNDGTHRIKRDDPALPQDWIIQVNLGPNEFDAFAYLFAAQSNPRDDWYDIEINVNGNLIRIRDVVNGSIQGVSSNYSPGGGIDSGDIFQIRMVGELNGANRIIRFYTVDKISDGSVRKQGDPVLRKTYNDTGDLFNSDPGGIMYGMDWHDRGRGDEFFLCGRNITVTGLPDGYQARVNDSSEVTESGGSVTLDVDAEELPASVTVVNAGGEDKVTFEDAWGGDTLAYTE